MARPRMGRYFLVFLALTAIVGLMSAGLAAMPPAETPIGNQATATYTDASGVIRTVTSNAVVTIVQAVYGLTLESDQVRQANPNSQVTFPLVLTNTGNAADSYALSLSNATGFINLAQITLYEDANGDGVADNTTPITTVNLAAGGVYHFVAVAIVPTGASGSGTFRVTAASGNSAETDFVTETINVTTDAVLNVTKSISVHQATPGTTGIIYTLTYTNSGNATAYRLTLTDALPAGLNYTAESGRWSGSGATALTDAPGGDPSGITYSYTAATRTIEAVIAAVPAGGSGTVSFTVSVDAAAPVGTTIDNYALVEHYAAEVGGLPIDDGRTNSAPLTILQTAGVTLVPDVTIPSATQGATVEFVHTLTNTGDGADTFDLTMSGNTFPVGTAMTLYRRFGATDVAMLDSDGDSLPDSGPMANGAAYTIVLKATLPGGVSGIGPYEVHLTATSNYDSSVAASVTDRLGEIAVSAVDLTSIDGATTYGAGTVTGSEAEPLYARNANPGDTVIFELYVRNTSAITDSYDLQATGTALPVEFRNLAGTVITRINELASGAEAHLRAVVTVPAGAAAGLDSIRFQAVSPITGASDHLWLAVNVGIVQSLSLTPNNADQIYPGGSVIYRHTLTYTSNVAGAIDVALSTAHTITDFTSTIYWDENENGVIDPDDDVITGFTGLNPGESRSIIVKVYAPASAAIRSTDICTVTATAAGLADATATDATTVFAANLFIIKTQALDANGDGTPEGAYTTGQLDAAPGACIRYTITITNNGTADATSVTFSDATPPFTFYDDGDGTTSPTGVACWTRDGSVFTAIAGLTDGQAGSFTINIGVIAPGETVTIYFGIRIDS